MLASGLRNNLGLITLDLSENCISDKGVMSLTDALYKHTSLEMLDLRNNQALRQDTQDAILDALDLSYRWEPISGDLKLALGMALHPRLGQDSQLFMLAYLPPSPFKTAVFTGTNKWTSGDKWMCFANTMTFKDNTLPPLKHYQTRPLERESALRLSTGQAINLRRRNIPYDATTTDGLAPLAS
eukprot:CAMPEP_0179414894 /NCGR_PEP_ID=MMETSP0799-20121207/5931_1 /TAXON_ID=46947 /ORGANISM="Geminigera cryophila, Strain CCMP2564" /LENGTH=183 /DNA_ID=CAMNT_0021187575 /DNA_START=165 /DNA_END=716 /DNA_ORIENTATION=+